MTHLNRSAATISRISSSMTPPTLKKKYPTIGSCSTCTWLQSEQHLSSCRGTACPPCKNHLQICNRFRPGTPCLYPMGSRQNPIVISSCDEEDPMKPCNLPVPSVELEDQIIHDIDDLLSESDQENETTLCRPEDDRVLASVPKHEERWRRSTTPWHLEGLAAMSQQELASTRSSSGQIGRASCRERV